VTFRPISSADESVTILEPALNGSFLPPPNARTSRVQAKERASRADIQHLRARAIARRHEPNVSPQDVDASMVTAAVCDEVLERRHQQT